MKSLADILINLSEKDSGKYLKHEWQLFAYRLALWLGDIPKISYYMRLAKNEERWMLEKAWDFVKEAHNPRSRAGLFVWKFNQLKKESKEKAKSAESPDNQKKETSPESPSVVE